MIVQVWKQEEDGQLDVFVFGEKLATDADGRFLLPGRFVTAMKVDDLPDGIAFILCDPPHPALCFYREDRVSFSRDAMREGLAVSVTTTYETDQWDGLFSLQATMDARRTVIAETAEFNLVECKKEAEFQQVSFSFLSPDHADHDLEQVIEAVAEKVRWVEEKGNERLMYGSGYL